MMGDPGCKGVLTLLGLVAVAEAEHQEAQANMVEDAKGGSYTYTTAVELISRWFFRRKIPTTDLLPIDPMLQTLRCGKPSHFSNAGDDSLLQGEIRILRNFLNNHQTNGMVISPPKTIMSKLGGVLCERLILRTEHNSITERDFNERNVLVDSLKVRLLSCATKPQQSSNEPNPALGKAQALMKSMDNLDDEWSNMKDLVLMRFQERMYKHLPHDQSGRISPWIELPKIFGGLGMHTEYTDLTASVETLSDSHLRLLSTFVDNKYDQRLTSLMLSVSTDRYARGTKFEESVFDIIIENLSLDMGAKPAKRTAIDLGILTEKEINYMSYWDLRTKLTNNGWISERDICRMFSRASLQKKLMTEVPTAGWRQASWKRRIQVFQKKCIELDSIYTAEGRIVDGSRQEFETLVETFILRSTNKSLSGLTWKEELFFHPDMISTNGTKPIKDFKETLATLELPPIIDKGWFEHHPT
jgi:hypothetical protein